MIRVFADAVAEKGALVTLGPEERHYLTRVRRCAVGDLVEVVGRADGRRARAAIADVRGGAIHVEIVEILGDSVAVLPVHVLAALPKRDLLDDVVRKLSEIGVASFTPMTTARSVVVPGEARMARWRRIAEEAMRQCGRGAPLEILGLRPAAEALAGAEAEARLVFDPRAECRRLSEACGPAASIAIAIGPEGGFTPEELEGAATLGYRGVGFGSNVLRLETAAIVAAALAVDALTR
jgi:16S rRNA (uracil1498-N3)-methyltransferase